MAGSTLNPDNFPQRPRRKRGEPDPALGPSDRSDTPSDRPGQPGTDTDSGGTGERQTVGKVPEAHDAGTDRVVSPQEAGLGGGLDQAEEAQQGKTDEEIAKERDLKAELTKRPTRRKK